MNSNSTKKEIRKFGIMAFIFFGCLCGISIWREHSILKYFFGLLSLLGAGFLLIPAPLAPVYRGWLKVTHLIGRVITMLMLTVAYYVVITPAALLKRIFGGRPLPLEPDPNALTYWVARNEPAQPKERFYKRY